MILLTPLMLRLHDRFGLAVPAVLVAGGVVADAFRFVGGISGAGWGTGIVVALLPHQLGFSYADGRLTRLSGRALVTMAISGLATLVLLTNPWVFGSMGDLWFPRTGHYPRSLVGGDKGMTNIYPPTLCLVAVAFFLVGAAMLLRGRVAGGWIESGPGGWSSA